MLQKVTQIVHRFSEAPFEWRTHAQRSIADMEQNASLCSLGCAATSAGLR